MLTDEQRDEILLGLQAGQARLEVHVHSIDVYVRAMARRLLSPTELVEIEAEVHALQQEHPVAT